MLTVAALMTTGPLIIERNQSLAEAANRMDLLRVRHLPVVDGHRVVGMLSEGDILRLRAQRPEVPIDTLLAGEAMGTDPLTVAPGAPADEVARTMAERGRDAALVVEDGRIAGIFTTTDALKAIGTSAGDQSGPGAAVAFDKVLCPIDFSTASRDALATALELARGSVTLFHATDLSFGGLGEAVWEGPEVILRLDQRVDEALRAWKAEHARDGGPEIVAVRGTGRPWEAITRHARETRTDLIVLGTHGRTGVRRALMGSVAEAVVRHAPCPVLVVRRKE